MRKERKIWISIITSLLIIIIYNINHPHIKAAENQERLFTGFFQTVYKTIKNSYIDEKETKELMVGAIKGMIKTLDDPHTALLELQQKENLEIEIRGQYGGLGIYISVRDNKLTVIAPMEDTPAQRAGILAGDRIVKIEGELVKNPDLNKIVKKLRGKAGTDVAISVEREGIDELIDYTLTRENIKIKSVKFTKIDNMGYIRLISFRKKAPGELKNALKKLIEKDKIKGIILDLRNNSGGLLDSAIKITDLFINEGIIVYTKTRTNAVNLSRGLNKKYYATSHTTVAGDIPLVVLVNKGTASASEILSGAIHDHKRGVLIGSTTFGKGSVQTVINLNNEYAMRYTTAYYYTPDGTKIHKKGIIPDIEVEHKYPNTKKENNEIKKIRDEKLVEDFIKKNKKPEKKDIDTFIKKLRRKRFGLKNKYIKQLIKKKLYKDKIAPVYTHL